MSFSNNLISWHRRKQNLPIHHESGDASRFSSVQHEMNRIFDDFFTGFQPPYSAREISALFEPKLDITETEKELRITIELPGMNDKDIDVTLSGNALTIKGDKREEKDDRTCRHYKIERSYGSFQRTIAMPCEIDSDKVDATFKNGVLSVTLPKSKCEQYTGKKIDIK